MTNSALDSEQRDLRTDDNGASSETITGSHTEAIPGTSSGTNLESSPEDSSGSFNDDISVEDHGTVEIDGPKITEESIGPHTNGNIVVDGNNDSKVIDEEHINDEIDGTSEAEDPSGEESSTPKSRRKRRKPSDIDLKEEFRKEAKPLMIIALLFLFIPLMATFIAPSFVEEDVKAFGDNEESYWNSIIYLVLILTFTFGILWVVKHFGKDPLRIIILGAFFMTMIYAFYPILAYIVPIEIAVFIGFLISIVITYFLVTFPEWYVVDSAGISVSIGVAAIIGISFAPGPFIFLMVMMLCYDAIAVYKTKHMIDLADNVMESNLPVLLVIPKKLPYTFLKKKGLKEQLDSGEERDALFIGLGDFIIPSSFAVSLSVYLGDNVSDTAVMGIDGVILVVAGVILGTLVGYLLLMAYVLKGKPQAGLPLLNGGAILGYLIPVLTIYGSLGLW